MPPKCLNKCCWCCSLPTGALFIPITRILMIIHLLLLEQLSFINFNFYIAVICLTIILDIIFWIILYIGLFLHQELYIFPYYVWYIIAYVFDVLYGFLVLLVHDFCSPFEVLLSILFLVTILLLGAYCIMALYSVYLLFKHDYIFPDQLPPQYRR